MCFPAWALVTMSILCERNQSESYCFEPLNPSCRVDAEMVGVPERQQGSSSSGQSLELSTIWPIRRRLHLELP